MRIYPMISYKKHRDTLYANYFKLLKLVEVVLSYNTFISADFIAKIT